MGGRFRAEQWGVSARRQSARRVHWDREPDPRGRPARGVDDRVHPDEAAAAVQERAPAVPWRTWSGHARSGARSRAAWAVDGTGCGWAARAWVVDGPPRAEQGGCVLGASTRVDGGVRLHDVADGGASDGADVPADPGHDPLADTADTDKDSPHLNSARVGHGQSKSAAFFIGGLPRMRARRAWVSVWSRPNGLPMANTRCPTCVRVFSA